MMRIKDRIVQYLYIEQNKFININLFNKIVMYTNPAHTLFNFYKIHTIELNILSYFYNRYFYIIYL